MSSLSLLNDRDLGVFPISIATSLAIEGLANLTPDREPVYPKGIKCIDVLMVNIRTLIRNIESTFTNDDIRKISPRDLADVVSQDMDGLVAAMNEISDGRVAVGFYYCEYRTLGTFRNANLVIPHTPGQKARHEKTSVVIGMLLDSSRQGGREIKIYDLYPDAESFGNDKVAFLTHLPLDVIQYRRYMDCFILESNTGKLKDRKDFHTKLHRKVEGIDLPFNMMTLQVFGDGKMFKPMNSDIVGAVIDVAKKGQWTSMTTPDKMRFWVSRMQLQGYAGVLQSLIKD